MKNSLKAQKLKLEFGTQTLSIKDGGTGIEVALNRDEDGRLTEKSRREILEALEPWSRSSTKALKPLLCVLPSRGASLRTYRLPQCGAEELKQLISLQLERDLPISADEFLFGSIIGPQSSEGQMEVSVVVLRKRNVEEIQTLLNSCGFAPVFCIGGVIVGSALRSKANNFAYIDVGSKTSELVIVKEGRPVVLKELSWGENRIDSVVVDTLGMSWPEAVSLRRSWNGAVTIPESFEANTEDHLRAGLKSEVQKLGSLIHSAFEQEAASKELAPLQDWKLFLNGEATHIPGFKEGLNLSPAREFQSEVLEIPLKKGTTPNLRALERIQQNSDLSNLALLDTGSLTEQQGQSTPTRAMPWLLTGVALALVALGLHWAEPLFKRGALEKQIEDAKNSSFSLSNEDQNRLSFLKRLRAERKKVKALDLIAAVSKASPEGILINNLTLDEDGQVSLDGTASSRAQANQFRAQLSHCGLFEQKILMNLTVHKDSFQYRMTVVALPGKTLTDFQKIQVEDAKESKESENSKENSKSEVVKEGSKEEQTKEEASDKETEPVKAKANEELSHKPNPESKTKEGGS